MGITIALPFILILSIIILIVVILGGSKDENLGDTLAYLTPINQAAKANGVPPLWAIADIAWESCGDWKATNSNTNGTIDAGLSQINNSNWPSYGLVDNPYDVNKNINAGQSILGNALRQYGNIEDALYAYNGGTPANGRKYNPDYVPKVAGKYALLTSSQLIVSVHSYDEEGLILTIGEAQVIHHHNHNPNIDGGDEEETVDLFNPSTITVKVTDKTGVVKLSNLVVNPSFGDGITFPPEATIYKFVGASLSKGDIVSIKTPDEMSTQINLN